MPLPQRARHIAEQRHSTGTATSLSFYKCLHTVVMTMQRTNLALCSAAVPELDLMLLAMPMIGHALIIGSCRLLATRGMASDGSRAPYVRASSTCASPCLASLTQLYHAVAALVPCCYIHEQSVRGACGSAIAAMLGAHQQQWWCSAYRQSKARGQRQAGPSWALQQNNGG